MELFPNQAHAAEAVGAFGTIDAPDQIITLYAANAVLKLSTLMALGASTDVSAIRAPQ